MKERRCALLVAWAMAAMASSSGCANQRINAQEQAAEAQIHQAADAGVPDEALQLPRTDLEVAEALEDSLHDLREEASEQLSTARARARTAEAVLVRRQQELVAVSTQLSQARRELHAAESRYQGAMGVGRVPSAAEGLVLVALRQRVQTLTLAERARQAWLRLAQGELVAAQHQATASQTLLATADERAELSSLLFDLAREEAALLMLEQAAGLTLPVEGDHDHRGGGDDPAAK